MKPKPRKHVRRIVNELRRGLMTFEYLDKRTMTQMEED